MQQLAYAVQGQSQYMNQIMESQTQLIMQMREKRSVGGGGGKGGGGEWRKSHEDRLNGKAMTAVDRFKGGEADWVDWNFKFLNFVGTGSMAMRKVLTWAE